MIRDEVWICQACGTVVPQDFDGCPNGGGINDEIMGEGEQHRIVAYVRRDVADTATAELRQVVEGAHLRRRVAVHAFEAAEAALAAARAGLEL